MTIPSETNSSGHSRTTRTLLPIVLSVFLLNVACTEYRLVQPDDGEPAVTNLAVGDTVEVVTADAQKVEFEITAIEKDALVGEDVRVAFSDVRLISVRQLAVSRASAMLVPIIITAAGIYAIQSIEYPPAWPAPAGGG